MDHTSATPTRAKRPKQAKASREKIPASGPRDPPEAAPPQATAAAADDDAMDTAGGAAAPAAVVPSGTDAASFKEVTPGGNAFDQTGFSDKLNACKHVPQPALRGPAAATCGPTNAPPPYHRFVDEVVGPPISQQVSTLIVQAGRGRRAPLNCGGTQANPLPCFPLGDPGAAR
jgi:hypothetical protein